MNISHAIAKFYSEWSQENGPSLLSSVFPAIWLALPAFVLTCCYVRWREGPKRQGFNWAEFLSSMKNSTLLGALNSFGPLMSFFLDPGKTAMEPLEMAWKLVGMALLGGGSDNTTVVVVRVDELEELS